MKTRVFLSVFFILSSIQLCLANGLPGSEIIHVSADPPEIGIKFYMMGYEYGFDTLYLAGDTIATSGGIAIINSGGELDSAIQFGQIIIFDSSNTTGFTINREADSIYLSSLILGNMPVLFTEYFGNMGWSPPPIKGHTLDGGIYNYTHSHFHMRTLSFDFCFPDNGWTDVVINEVNIHGTWGENSNFIELYNMGDSDISLEGWHLVCDTIYDFPDEAVIHAHGFYVVDESDFPVNFDMDVEADNIYLISAQQLPEWPPHDDRRVDQVGWSSDHGVNVSFMRYPDGDTGVYFGFFHDGFRGYDDASSSTFENGFPTRGAPNRHDNPGFVVIGANAFLEQRGSVEICWANPVWDADFDAAILVKSLEGYVENPDDGEVIYQGVDHQFIDSNAPLDEMIYYTIFARKTDSSYSIPVDESQVRFMIRTNYVYLPGDVNMYNGSWPAAVIGGDVTYLVNYFRSVPSSQRCLLDGFWVSSDVNGDCNVIGSDVTRLVNYLSGTGIIEYCPDYEPLWFTPADLPEDMPPGWPNCD